MKWIALAGVLLFCYFIIGGAFDSSPPRLWPFNRGWK